MSMCATEDEIQCFCLKLRVKWCDQCSRWVCRMAYRGHTCLPPQERIRWRAQKSILNKLFYRIYLLQQEEAEEQEWDAIVSQPHTRAALRRLAQDALQEHEAGETEEGGFALEEEAL